MSAHLTTRADCPPHHLCGLPSTVYGPLWQQQAHHDRFGHRQQQQDQLGNEQQAGVHRYCGDHLPGGTQGAGSRRVTQGTCFGGLGEGYGMQGQAVKVLRRVVGACM